MSGPLLEARGVQVRIGGTPILHGADLVLHPGRLVAVVGPNGAGKSTLVRTVAGLQKPSAGIVSWGGRDIGRIGPRRLARLRAFVPQRARVPDGVTVRQAVAIGRAPHLGPLRRPARADRAAVDRALERTGADRFAGRMLATLSGGELQRVQIAVALAQEAPALLADEPTSSLDLGATSAVARLLRGLAADGLGIVLVAHDLALAAAVADEVVVMAGGRTIAAGAAHDVLGAERLAAVWGVEAALSTDDEGRTALRVDWLAGHQAAESIRVP
jgi:iron complex transport system ATP-binding protein